MRKACEDKITDGDALLNIITKPKKVNNNSILPKYFCSAENISYDIACLKKLSAARDRGSFASGTQSNFLFNKVMGKNFSFKLEGCPTVAVI